MIQIAAKHAAPPWNVLRLFDPSFAAFASLPSASPVPVARTDDPQEAAAPADPELLIRQGIELRRKGKDAQAEGYFRRAYEMAPTPRTAAQLGLDELAVGKYVGSEAHLTEALTSNDPWVEKYRDTLDRARTSVRAHLLRVEIVNAPSGTTFAPDGGDAHSLPADGVLWFASTSPVTVHLEAEGHSPATFPVEGAAGDSQRIVVQMSAIGQPPKAENPTIVLPGRISMEALSARRRRHISGILVAGLGVVSVVAGGVSYAQGISRRNEYRTAINANGAIPYNPRDGNWDTWRDTGVGLLIGGGAAIAVGTVVFLAGQSVSAEKEPSLSFVGGPGFGIFSFQRTF